MTQVLIQVKEICLFGLLGAVLPNSQLSPENPTFDLTFTEEGIVTHQ
jgi:hypothetical protein